jgi:antitoxin PrlF
MNAVVAERGQVTIPKRLRDRLGIGPGTVVDFEEDHGRLTLSKVVRNDPVTQVLGCIQLDADTDSLIRELRGDA